MWKMGWWLRVLAFGALAAVVLICLQLLRYSLVLGDWSLEAYLLAVGVPLLAAGLIVGRGWAAQRNRPAPRPLASPLTRREHEILAEVARGLSNQQVADRLFVSVSTVKTHLKSVYAKLEVERRTQAVDKARRLGLI